ncbi:MAG: methyltransferase [Magnetospirillum sp.]|nr:methyltransferase [Magnetospirillum sp.]
MLDEAGGIVADRVGPQKGGGCKCWASPRGGWSYIKKVNKVSVTVLDNWGNGGGNFTRTIPFDKLTKVMTAAEVEAARVAGLLIETADGTGFCLRQAPGDETREETKSEQNDRLHREHLAATTEEAPASSAEFREMADQLRNGAAVKVVSAPQLFPTPADITARMVDLAEIEDGQSILEPSAGTGAILRAIKEEGADVETVAVEINATLAGGLGDMAGTIHTADFLDCADLGRFDRVLMNPPFANGADIRHIKHAVSMLKPGGRVVAICANGPRQQGQLRPLASQWEELPAGTFEGTGVRAALLVIDAPEAAEEPATAAPAISAPPPAMAAQAAPVGAGHQFALF